jgi:curved DNA-binding protein CbpA
MGRLQNRSLPTGRVQLDGEMGRQDGDFYAVLGIERDATDSEIARAYRRAARATHPDTHPHEPAAAERFRTIAIAYETLGNPHHRAAYDRTRPAIQRGARWEQPSHLGPPAVTPVQLGHRQQSRPTAQNSRMWIDPVRQAAETERDLVELATLLSRLNQRWRLFEASHPWHPGRRGSD